LSVSGKLINPQEFIVEPLEVNADIPGFSLPLNTADVENYKDFFEKMPLNPEVLNLLEKNAFVVIPTPLDIAERNLPILKMILLPITRY